MDPVLSETAPAQVALEAKQENGIATTKRHEEYQYLDLVQEILETGEHRPDRYALLEPSHPTTIFRSLFPKLTAHI